MSAETVKAILKELAATYTPDEAPSVDERVSLHFWGQWDEEIAFAFGMADLVSDEPCAKHLYEWSCAGDMVGPQAFVTAVQSWGANAAAQFAMGHNSRKRPNVPSFRLDWGRQAANDGCALAMWGEGIRDLLPGVNKRASKYGCRDEAYLRVRDHVEQEARELIFRFRRDMEMAVSGKFDPDFRARWERKTGKLWPR